MVLGASPAVKWVTLDGTLPFQVFQCLNTPIIAAAAAGASPGPHHTCVGLTTGASEYSGRRESVARGGLGIP